jgi:hypothetical protein
MKTRSGLIATLALAGLLPLAALAGDKPAAAAPVTTTAAATAKSRTVEIVCESTGSRIRRTKAQDCAKAMQPTTNYYQHDVERTSQGSLASSLKDLDPRFH